MIKILIILIGKMVATLSRLFNIGAGGTWSGEIGLALDKSLIKKLIADVKKGVILVVGTNGKTTTAKMIKTILEIPNSPAKRDSAPRDKFPALPARLPDGQAGRQIPKVIHNQSGANLLNGVASALIRQADVLGKVKADWAVFEVDEASLPLVLKEFTPKIVVCMNLFRDQLDRYGEIDLIAEKWHKAFLTLPLTATVILNADDPQIAYLGKDLKAKVLYFGLEDSSLFLAKIPHAADSIYCLSCGNKLEFKGVYFSHLGVWKCKKCGEKRPRPDLSFWQWPLSGIYNRYNTLAAVLAAKILGIEKKRIQSALKKMTSAFGRGEEFIVKGKKVKILLSKNPTGFNVSIRRIIESQAKMVLLALNDRIPDGRDVSWIWDVDFEELVSRVDHFIISGDRAYDLGLRLKHSLETQEHKNIKTPEHNSKFKIFQELEKAIFSGLENIKKNETLHILPTYSAMLEIRKILGGRKIL